VRAARISHYGDPSVVEIFAVEAPTVGPGQVVVDVHASSLNPLDSALRAGSMQDTMPLQLPATLGGDIAGLVREVGEGVRHLAPGDRVYGQAYTLMGNSGAFAEQALVRGSHVGAMPRNVSFQGAASLPIVGTTAIDGIIDRLSVQQGQRVYIGGGSGSVGSLAVQLAKHLGAYVVTTASGPGIDLARSMGADEVLDYLSDDLGSIQGIDAVFDTVGGQAFEKSFAVLKPGAIAVTVGGPFEVAAAEAAGVNASHQVTDMPRWLPELTHLVDAGILTPRVSTTYPLEHIAEAFTARESGAVKGKIVITMR
jgi:NADPH:quinone reductase-like Zn-dependent oxidoreductase